MNNPVLSRSATPRIGEILVLGAHGADVEFFLRAFCTTVVVTDQDILLGQMTVSRTLSLYCYGINPSPPQKTIAWDLFAKKMLGYIVLCNWFDEASFSDCKKIIAFATRHFDAPFVVAADVGEQTLPYGETLRRPEIVLSAGSRFIFCRKHNVVHVRKVMLGLINLLLEHCAG